VKIDNGANRADVRIRLVDAVETADFTLVDDAIGPGDNACQALGVLKTVKVVGAGAADLTISLSSDDSEADVKLFVHSARVGHRDAAALFGAIRFQQMESTPARER
jgi:hypothetical protein